MTQLILWDIDHTLIDTRGVGRELSASAFECVTGQPMRAQSSIDGITEQVIFRETAKLHGLTTSRRDFDRFAEALVEQHRQRAGDLRERGHALPGAASTLDALATAGVRQTVVTGNVRRVAEIKLSAFGLDHHIRWEIGAYGDDRESRADLVRLSLVRADVAPSNALLIGDTPADVTGGRENGVRVIAVASGKSDEAALRATGAEIVVPDLSDICRSVLLL